MNDNNNFFIKNLGAIIGISTMNYNKALAEKEDEDDGIDDRQDKEYYGE